MAWMCRSRRRLVLAAVVEFGGEIAVGCGTGRAVGEMELGAGQAPVAEGDERGGDRAGDLAVDTDVSGRNEIFVVIGHDCGQQCPQRRPVCGQIPKQGVGALEAGV